MAEKNLASWPGATGELTNYSPSWRDRLADAMGGAANAISGKPYPEARRDSMTLMGLAPGTGTVMSAEDAASAAKKGDWKGAGLNALGAIPDGGTLGKAIFVGLASKMADRGALKTAQEMLAKGATREQALKDTGWFQQHGDWKTEISDKGAGGLSPDARNEMVEGDSPGTMGRLADTIQHPDLFKAHPELGDISTTAELATGSGGWFNTVPRPSIHVSGPDEETLRSIMLHEAQHGTQRMEGFPRGGSPADRSLQSEMQAVQPKAQALYDQLDQERANWVRGKLDLGNNEFVSGDMALKFREVGDEWKRLYPEKAKALDRAFETYYGAAGPHAGYNHLAGEVEARNVQTRRDMSPEERRAKPPWATQSVPDDLQIVRRDPGGDRSNLAKAMAKKTGGHHAL